MDKWLTPSSGGFARAERLYRFIKELQTSEKHYIGSECPPLDLTNLGEGEHSLL